MKHKPDIKILVRYLSLNENAKQDLAQFMAITPNAVEQWMTKGQLPRTKRRFILNFMNERLREKAA